MKKSEREKNIKTAEREREKDERQRKQKESEQGKRMQRRNIRLLPLGVEVGRRFAFYGDVLCKRVRVEIVGWRGW